MPRSGHVLVELPGPSGVEPAEPVRRNRGNSNCDGRTRARGRLGEGPPLILDTKQKTNERKLGKLGKPEGNEHPYARSALETTVIFVGPIDTNAEAVSVCKDAKIDGEFACHGALPELEVNDLTGVTIL